MARVILAPVPPKLCPALDAIRAFADAVSDEMGSIFAWCEVADLATDLVAEITDEAERS